MTPQPGILALGTAAQCHIEFDRRPECPMTEFVGAFASLEEPGASVGGVNVVVGFRPELWAEVAGEVGGPAVHGFLEPVTGPDGFAMPATQHDAWLWIAGASQDVVFDVATGMTQRLAGAGAVADEVLGWPYQRIRDLTGFIDGTENPPLAEASGVVFASEGSPGADGTVVLIQKWRHRTAEWSAISQEEQEKVIGRTKPDSVELDEAAMPKDSHVARTVVEEDGAELAIFRRNTPYGGITDHGTMFVGFCARQTVLHLMLERMAGIGDGIRDALTHYAEPLTGAYYLVPALTALDGFRDQATGD